MGMGITCFMSGARIRAARGDVAVDAIATGEDVVVIRNGRECLEPVKWIGHSFIDIAHHARPEEAAPIRFRKDALADNQPIRDLVVSPEHCLIIDDLCVPARMLVNGGSIVSERSHAPFTYYHLELERHGILLAENAPTESYLDTGNRSSFDNADQPRQLHPGFSVDATAERWLTDACAPLAQLPEVQLIWHRLAARSLDLGYPVATAKTVDDADPHLLVDGRVVRPVCDRDSCLTFMVPGGAESVCLMSRYGIPSDNMIASQRDTRRLGLRVDWITVRSDKHEMFLPADHPGLSQGWNAPEADDKTIWRWTDGAGVIPWDGVACASVVTIRCVPLGTYPVSDAPACLVA